MTVNVKATKRLNHILFTRSHQTWIPGIERALRVEFFRQFVCVTNVRVMCSSNM